MEVEWNSYNDETYIKTKIDNQTFYMAFQFEQINDDTLIANVYMTLYNKRKHTDANEAAVLTTGKNPMETLRVARRAFEMLEEDAIYSYIEDYNVIIYCTWLDNRRRNIYERFLTRKGYSFGVEPLGTKKCLMKKFKKGELPCD